MESVAAGHTLTERMMGAARLQVWAYEEVEADETATGQAAGVVAIVAVAQAIGSMGSGSGGVIGGLLSAFIGWAVWSGITYVIGTRIFRGTATWGELLRTIGFAQAPGVLNFLGIIPVFGGLVRAVVAIWILIAGIVAIRQALDFDTGRAVLTAVIGWLALVIPMLILGGIGMGLAHLW
jgi:hypothetical protein